MASDEKKQDSGALANPEFPDIMHSDFCRHSARASRAGATNGVNMNEDKPRGNLTVRISAMPADTNANGDIFGGWVLSRMDQAGGIAGVERARGRVVTIALEGMTFIRPVRVGDVLEVYTEIGAIGRTSMKIHVEAWARRFMTHHHEKVTDGNFTFVAIDDNGKPRPIPNVS